MTVGPENGVPGQPSEESSPASPEPSSDADHGSVRWQDPATAKPRPPTVAEARARDKARKAREAEEEIEAVKAEKARRRAATGKKVLIGSAVGVGVVAVVAAGYTMFHEDRVGATCVKDGTNEVVPDSYCSSGYSSGGSTFIYAGAPYRYYYGGTNGGIGTTARGGTLTLPKGTTATTKSGTSISKSGSSVSRGGFGSSSSGSSGS